MLSKETFCKALTMIREQRQINETFSDALELVGEGYYCFGVNSRYLDALLMVMKEAMDDKYDYIDWWLYEAAEDYQVEDDEHIWCLLTWHLNNDKIHFHF